MTSRELLYAAGYPPVPGRAGNGIPVQGAREPIDVDAVFLALVAQSEAVGRVACESLGFLARRNLEQVFLEAIYIWLADGMELVSRIPSYLQRRRPGGCPSQQRSWAIG